MAQILSTLEQFIPQGVETQLKVLQTLVSLLSTNVGGSGPDKNQRLVQGDELGIVSFEFLLLWAELTVFRLSS